MDSKQFWRNIKALKLSSKANQMVDSSGWHSSKLLESKSVFLFRRRYLKRKLLYNLQTGSYECRWSLVPRIIDTWTKII